jgi:hypothetical protein
MQIHTKRREEKNSLRGNFNKEFSRTCERRKMLANPSVGWEREQRVGHCLCVCAKLPSSVN